MYKNIMLVLTLMLLGRAMTLVFVHRAGAGDVGDPAQAWLMPLLGDAVIGITALFLAYLIWKRRGLWVWTAIIVWNCLAIWGVLSAYIIHLTNPWPEFFMLQAFGASMFFVASAMHLVIIILPCRQSAIAHFLVRGAVAR